MCFQKRLNVGKKFHELSHNFVLTPPSRGRIPFKCSAGSLFPKQFGPWAVNGKTWRLIKSWYSSPTSRVKHQNVFSAPFPINRGVKQGSVLSPSLFLIVMNSLLKKMRNSNNGGSLHGTFVGIAIHADDVRSIAPNIQSVISQSSDILSFTTDLGLKLNTSKLELIQMSQTTSKPIEIAIANHIILTTKSSASCLGVKWCSDLSARDSVNSKHVLCLKLSPTMLVSVARQWLE